MIRYFKFSRLHLALYILFVPISILCSLSFIFTFQSIIDIASSGSLSELKKIAILAVLVIVADSGCCLFIQYLKKSILKNSIIHLKEDTISSIISLPFSDFSEVNSSEYISLLSNDIRMVEQGYFNNILSLYHKTINLIIYTIAAWNIHPVVTILILIGAFISLRIPGLFSNKLQILQNNYSNTLAAYTVRLKDFLNGFQVIKTFNIESSILNLHHKANTDLESSKTNSEYYTYRISWLSGNITQSMYIFILLVGAYYVLQGELTIGLIIALTELIGGIIAPIEFITSELTELNATTPIITKFKNTLKHLPNIKKTPTSFPTLNAKNLVINNLDFSYTSTNTILKDISLVFEKGKKYAIVGDSGSGKSTLIKLLLGLYSDYNGDITLDDTHISSIPRETLHKNIAMVSQDIFIFDDTLMNNICLFTEYTKEQVEHVLKITLLDNVINKLPQGLNTILSENGSILSGGEKQRIGIARALIRNPNFIILDEATSNLDNKTAYTIEKNILALTETGCISIIHRLNPHILEYMDEIIILKDGELIEKDSFQNLAHEGTYFNTLYELYQK